MKNFDYVAEANVTCSNKFHGELVSVDAFRSTLIRCIEALKLLDVLKKTIFYGRPLSDTYSAFAPANSSENANSLPQAFGITNRHLLIGENLIHGIIGKATEDGELLEALYNALFEAKPIDLVNIEEEVGDGFWYDAILAKTCGFTFDAAQRRNIAKLRHRFPNAFTEHDAVNRDLFGERSILEAAATKQALSMPECIALAEEMAKRQEKLTACHDNAVSDAGSHKNEYLRGMANGLILAKAIMDGGSPAYIEVPKPSDSSAVIAD